MTAAEQEQTERDITFFVACFNEELNIVEAIEAVLKAAAEAGKTFDIVIVDDASTDRSVQVIRDYMDKHPDLPIKLVINQKIRGWASITPRRAFTETVGITGSSAGTTRSDTSRSSKPSSNWVRRT